MPYGPCKSFATPVGAPSRSRRQDILQLAVPGASGGAPGQEGNDSILIEEIEARPPPSPPPPIGISPADVVTVNTTSELQQVVQGGARDIEVVNHLDLRSLQLVKNPSQVRSTS
jgi:hypothetical protein